MATTTPQTALRAFLYGGGAILLAFDFFYLLKALFTTNFIPILPILVGILTASGLLAIVYSEHRAREEDKRDHRRISRVSHQLETPLNSLQEDLEQLIAGADKLPSETRLKLKHMETKTKVLLENIRDVFLTLQALEQPLAQELRVYNVCTLVTNTIEKLQPLARARNVELVHKLHCADAPVKVDRRLFTIALSHLIENALTYTLTPASVNVAITRGDKRVRIIIQDRGIGISDSDTRVIFQPFARGERAGKHDPDGIGVGLTVTRLIVRDFGGRLSWKNRERGMGAQFEISLPLAKK